MVIFLSLHNPLWDELVAVGVKPTVGDIRRLCGDLKAQNHLYWDDGGDPTFELAEKVFRSASASIDACAKPERQAALQRLVNQARENFANDEINLYDTALAMRIRVEAAQMLIDELVYSKYPVLPELHYSSRKKADAAFAFLGGTYELWAWHRTEILKCALRVRYVLDVRKVSAIRCKLNLPPDGISRLRQHEYDGFLSWRHAGSVDHLAWVFEGRKQHVRHKVDYLFAITSGLRDFEGTAAFVGKFIGPSYDGQSAARSDQDVAFADVGQVLALRTRVPHDEGLTEIREFMGNVSVILDPNEIQRLADLAREVARSPRLPLASTKSSRSTTK